MDSLLFKASLSLTGLVIITTILQLYLDKIREQEERKRIIEGFDGNPFSLIPMVFEVLIAAINFLIEFPQRLEYMIDTLTLVGGGLFGEMMAIGNNTPKLLNQATKMVTCSVTRISKFGSCFHWYILDLLMMLFYTITVRLIVFIIYFFTFGYVNLTPPLDNFWSLVEELDVMAYGYIKPYHLIHYPDYITSECYSCDVIDQTVVMTALKELGQPALDIVNGAMTLMSVFTGDKPNKMSAI